MFTARIVALAILLLFCDFRAAYAGGKCSTPSPACKDTSKEGLTGTPSPDTGKRMETLKKDVGKLRKRLEEWGSVTVSAPVVMREAGEFSLGKETDFPNTLQYINLALTSAQGGVSQSTATSLANQFDLSVTPTFSINPLTGAKVARPSTSTDSGLTPDTVANGTSINLMTNLATPAGGSAGQFAGPGSLVVGPNGQGGVLKAGAAGASTLAAPSSFTLSGSQAALIGSNAKLSEMLMRKMAEPEHRLFTNPGFQIHFAIVQVSCNPGWRTKENYIADVSATIEYYDSVKDKVKGCENHNPLVFSVLPLIDAQTLELQNSERRLTQLAASLSAAYPTAAANLKGRDLIQFVKQFQKDTQTVTPRTVANSYSTGSTFGFRLMPSLTALKDPARSGSKPANILQATSFPVLVTVVLSPEDAADADSVRVNIANRWLINDNPKIVEFWRCIGLPLWRDCTGNRVDLAMDYDRAKEGLSEFKSAVNRNARYAEASMTFERDLTELRNKILGTSRAIFCLPGKTDARRKSLVSSAKSPIAQQVVPNTLTAKGDATLFISGLNFFCDDTSTGPSTPFSALHPYTLASPQADPGINVWLGQVKGTVIMCNGDDQLVVKFSGLDSLSGMQLASLVIQTNYGAGAWGKAVTINTSTPAAAPTNNATITDVTGTTADPDGDAFDLTLIVNGKSLDLVRNATLTNDGVPVLKDAKLSTILRADGNLLLLSWTKIPAAALANNAILTLTDGTGDNSKVIKQAAVTLPGRMPPTAAAKTTITALISNTDPVPSADNSTFSFTLIASGSGLSRVQSAKLDAADPFSGKVTIDSVLNKGDDTLLLRFSGVPANAFGATVSVLLSTGKKGSGEAIDTEKIALPKK